MPFIYVAYLCYIIKRRTNQCNKLEVVGGGRITHIYTKSLQDYITQDSE